MIVMIFFLVRIKYLCNVDNVALYSNKSNQLFDQFKIIFYIKLKLIIQSLLEECNAINAKIISMIIDI